MQIADFERFLRSSFRNITHGEEDVILGELNDAIGTVYKKYDVAETQPGRLRTIYKRQMLKLYNETKLKGITYQVIDSLQDQFDGLDEITSLEKIRQFCTAIQKAEILTPKLSEFFDHLIKVAESHAQLLNDENPWSRTDFLNEVQVSMEHAGLDIEYDNFRQLQSRLKKTIKRRLPDSGTLLHLMTKEEDALQLLYETLSRLTVSYLNAYRFTEDELTKMMWLKQLFQQNDYSFSPNRFPEVYYDDFDKAASVFPGIRHHRDLNECPNPDSLGVYVYRLDSSLPCAESDEGVIILFKDRIEKYCWLLANSHDFEDEMICRKIKNPELPADAVLDEEKVSSIRFVVLMHELGHWLSHWAVCEGRRWNFGFQLPNTKTKEALAQLVTYWASESNPIHSQTLVGLSPKDSDGKVNANAIYGGYIQLTKFSKVSVLKKLSALREFWILKDEIMMDFLKGDSDSIEDFLRGAKQKDESIVFVEDALKNTIFENEACAEAFGRNLDFEKLLRLAVLKIEWIEVKAVPYK